MNKYLRLFYAHILEWYLNTLDYIHDTRTWRVRVQWKNTCVWHETGESAGRCLVVGEENGRGKRRLRILVKPEKPWKAKETESWYEGQVWLNQPRIDRDYRQKIKAVK